MKKLVGLFVVSILLLLFVVQVKQVKAVSGSGPITGPLGSPTPAPTKAPTPTPLSAPKFIYGGIEDANGNIAQNSSFSIICNGQFKKSVTDYKGSFKVNFNKNCPAGSTVELTVELGIPFLPGTQEIGTGVVQVSGNVGKIKLTLPTPPKVQLAINWANAQIGQTTGPQGVWNFKCLQFVADAWATAGVTLVNTPNAFTYWITNPNHFTKHPESKYNDTPPLGALVFWGPNKYLAKTDPADNVGHVAISLGNGQVVSTPAYPYGSNPSSVFTFSLSQRPATPYNYLGWMMPQ